MTRFNRAPQAHYFADGSEDNTRAQPFIVDADEPAVSGTNILSHGRSVYDQH